MVLAEQVQQAQTKMIIKKLPDTSGSLQNSRNSFFLFKVTVRVRMGLTRRSLLHRPKVNKYTIPTLAPMGLDSKCLETPMMF